MDKEEKTVKQNLIYDGKILQLYNDEILTPNGKTAYREIINHHGGASILPIDDEGNIYLVEQYRYAYKQLLLEIPAGKLEKGEDAKVCAIRELKEEIGAECKEIKKMALVYPTPGYTNEPLHIFVATGLTFGDTKWDDDEYLNIKKIPFDKALEMVKNGEIKDGKSVVAILRYALFKG